MLLDEWSLAGKAFFLHLVITHVGLLIFPLWAHSDHKKEKKERKTPVKEEVMKAIHSTALFSFSL